MIPEMVSNTYVSYLVLLFVLAFCLYKYLVSNFDYWEKRQVEFVKPIPFFGSLSKTFLLQKSVGFLLADFYNRVQKRFFGIFVLNEPVLVIRDPELIKHILIKDFEHFGDRSNFVDENIDNIGSNFLFFSKYKKWKILRMKTSPIFSSGKIKNMFLKMEEITNDMKVYIDKNMSHTSAIEDARELCNRYSMNVLAACIYGLKGGCFEDKHAIFYDIGQRIFGYSILNDLRIVGYTINKSFIKLTRLKLLDSYVMKFITKTFGSQVQEREKSNIKFNDLVDILVELKRAGNIQGVHFDGTTVLGIAAQFFVAGYETVSTTLSFGLYELALNQDVQQRLKDELKTALIEEGKLDYGTIHKIPYLDQVVKETLRKYPVLPYLDRHCLKEYRIPDSDLILYPGSTVYIPMFGLHYDEKYFPNSNGFVPERFSPENKDSFPATAYLPFGLGPRTCIGERFALTSTKLAIAKLLLEYDIEPCDETPIPVEFKASGITLMPTKKLLLKFKKSINECPLSSDCTA